MSSSPDSSSPQQPLNGNTAQAPNGTEPALHNDAIQLTRCPDIIMHSNTPKGRGIFATAPMPARTVIDVCPVLVFDPQEYEQHVGKSRLWYYSFNWPIKSSPAAAHFTEVNGARVSKTIHQTQALPLGLGAMFNHATSSSIGHNVGFTRDIENEVIRYTALRNIEAGEELCICYGDSSRLGFEDTDGVGSGNGDGEGEAGGIEGIGEVFD